MLLIGIGLRARELVDFSLVYQVPYLRLDLFVPLSFGRCCRRSSPECRHTRRRHQQASSKAVKAGGRAAQARALSTDTRAAGQPRYAEHCSKRHRELGSLAVSSSSWLAGARQAGRRAAHTAQARARSAGKPGKQAHTAQARKLTFVLCSVECWKRFLRSWIMPPQFLEGHDACPRLFCLSK